MLRTPRLHIAALDPSRASPHCAAKSVESEGRRSAWDPGMDLAVILFVSMFCASSPLPAMAARPQNAPQAAPSTKAAETTTPQDPATAPSPENPSVQPASSAGAPAQTPSGQHPPITAKRPRHKKKVIASDCNIATGSSPAVPGNVAGSAQNSGTSSTAADCPPSKVIVRHGGTSEPSIQLAGGAAGGQTSHQRDTANQMLETTDANLKKIAGRQLSSSEQDMVNQIRQFMAQSKAAVDSGDLERARTLAWKAQLLSEELVKPKQ
jgi:hypothetical protein